MAQLAAFDYCPGGSRIHGLDVRIKIACVVMISLSAVGAVPIELAVLSFLVGGAMVWAGISIRLFFRATRIFFLLLIIVFLARALSFEPGETAPVYLFGIFPIPGAVAAGVVICWRLIVVVAAGFVFSATSRPKEVKAGVQWYLAPVPRVPEKRVALMLGLIVWFIPRMFRQASEIRDAQRARCVDQRKNPVYRARHFVIPLARKTFEDADKLVLAMEARCYREDRTDPDLSTSRIDWIVAATVFIIFGLIMVG